MGAFATQFEVALRETGFRQIEVVRRAGKGVSATQVSRYVKGEALPELPALEALVQIFPEPVRERLITAYLLDHIPPCGAHLVSVQPMNAPTGEEPAPVYGKAVKGSELAAALSYLEERALTSRPIADMIIATAEALKPGPSNFLLDMDDQGGADQDSRVQEAAPADAEA